MSLISKCHLMTDDEFADYFESVAARRAAAVEKIEREGCTPEFGQEFLSFIEAYKELVEYAEGRVLMATIRLQDVIPIV
jgi:hypothetical protein